MSVETDQVEQNNILQENNNEAKSENVNVLVPQILISHVMIHEQTYDDKGYHLSHDKQDFSTLTMNEDMQRLKQEQERITKSAFLQSDEASNFTEVLAISFIRLEYSNYGLFQKMVTKIENAVIRAIKDCILNLTKKNDKDTSINLDWQYYLRCYVEDVSISFITSTGQLKSTAFIWVENSLLDQLRKQQFDFQFEEPQTKVSIYFHTSNISLSQVISPKSTTTIPSCTPSLPPYFNSTNEERKEMSCQSLTIQINGLKQLTHSQQQPTFTITTITTQTAQDLELEMQSSQTSSNQRKLPLLPLCHGSNWIKQAFIVNDKFRNEYILIRKNDDDLKLGVNIYYVYRPIDDQIYAVKKSRLNSQFLSFNDVFSSLNLQEMTPDQRKIREAKILSKLTHPNILRLYDWWIEEECGGYALYMQLEYCSFPGYKYAPNDLLNYAYYYMNEMDNIKKIDTIKIIMLQIIDGLEYIHKRGIVHRDLKPENIFVTINKHGELQVMLADFDQGKDVRESKLSIIGNEKISEVELNSIKSKNTIQSGTSGYQTPNSLQGRPYDQSDEFYALGITLLHLVLTFPGEPRNRNHYATTFSMSDIDDILQLINTWANKYVKNKPKDFNFSHFLTQLTLAKQLLDKKFTTHEQIRQVIKTW